MATVLSELKLRGYETLYTSARQEVTTRLSRDSSLQVQLIASVGAVAAVSAVPGETNLIVIAPAVALYFTVVMAHNRWMLAILGDYLRIELEPRMSELTGIPSERYWEKYLKDHAAGWERLPRLEPLASWGVFVAVFAFVGIVHTLTLDALLGSILVYFALNTAATVYAVTGFKPERTRPTRR